MNESGLARRIAALALAFALAAQASARQQQPAGRGGRGRGGAHHLEPHTGGRRRPRRGRPSGDGLTAEDFELSEDGRAQTITNFSYVDTAAEGAASSSKPAAGSPRDAKADARANAAKGAVPLPPARVRPEAARRRFAFVVDDLGLSFQATAYVRNFLKDFARKRMRPGDLVAVVRTSAGVGALQQFTGDPLLVERAIELIRFRPGFRAPTGSFAAPAETAKDGGAGEKPARSQAKRKSRAATSPRRARPAAIRSSRSARSGRSTTCCAARPRCPGASRSSSSRRRRASSASADAARTCASTFNAWPTSPTAPPRASTNSTPQT